MSDKKQIYIRNLIILFIFSIAFGALVTSILMQSNERADEAMSVEYCTEEKPDGSIYRFICNQYDHGYTEEGQE